MKVFPAFVFRVKGKLTEEEFTKKQQDNNQFAQILSMKKEKNIKGKSFDSSKCPKEAEFIINVAVHGKFFLHFQKK